MDNDKVKLQNFLQKIDISFRNEIKFLSIRYKIPYNIAIDYWRWFIIWKQIYTTNPTIIDKKQLTQYNQDEILSQFYKTVNICFANNLSNLCQQVSSMLVKNFYKKCKNIKKKKFKKFKKIQVQQCLMKENYNMILRKVYYTSKRLNQQIKKKAPWKLIKGSDEEKQEVYDFLIDLVPQIINIVDTLEPFCPHICKLLLNNLELKEMPQVVCKRLNSFKS